MVGEEVFTRVGNGQDKATGNRLPLRDEAGNGHSLRTGLPRGWEHLCRSDSIKGPGLHKVMEQTLLGSWSHKGQWRGWREGRTLDSCWERVG